MVESIALLLQIIVPLAIVFVLLEALSFVLPAAIRRWRVRFSPDVADRDITWSTHAEVLAPEGEASLAGKPLHPASNRPLMNNRPIRQAA